MTKTMFKKIGKISWAKISEKNLNSKMWKRIRAYIRKWRSVQRPILVISWAIGPFFVPRYIGKCPKRPKNSIPGPVSPFWRRYQWILLRRAWMKNKYGIHALSWAGVNEKQVWHSCPAKLWVENQARFHKYEGRLVQNRTTARSQQPGHVR